ncbi:hypothetical protein AV540_16465 [Brevibacillus parabrevis]|nr:hypothetical protein AV540_16465 [Brevibacillus parabrevis]
MLSGSGERYLAESGMNGAQKEGVCNIGAIWVVTRLFNRPYVYKTRGDFLLSRTTLIQYRRTTNLRE